METSLTQEDKFRSRKWIAFRLIFWISTGMLVVGMIAKWIWNVDPILTNTQWVSIVSLVYGSYGAANVVEKTFSKGADK